MPASERDLILRCRIGNTIFHTSPWVVGTGASELIVFNMDNDKVGAFSGEAKWVMFVTSRAQLERKGLESAVQKLIRARQEDEFTYGRPEKK